MTLKIGRRYRLTLSNLTLEIKFDGVYVGMVFECFDRCGISMVKLRPLGYKGDNCWINYEVTTSNMWALDGVYYRNKRRTS